MEYKIEPDDQSDGMDSKSDAINDAKDRFYQIIKRKIGDLLVDQISRITGSTSQDHTKVTFLKFPHFLKPIFSFYNDNKLLIEASFLYILFCLEQMNPELQKLYEHYISKIEYPKANLMEMRDLIRINKTIEPQFVCKYEIPAYLLPSYSIYEENFPHLIVFGLIKIFEWLNVFEGDLVSLNPSYEQSFAVAHSIARDT
jgi:hypothetical protein